jgi:transposase
MASSTKTSQHQHRSPRRYSLSQKIAIVRESLSPGVRVSHIAQKHGLARNLLYYWRKVYREMAHVDLDAVVQESDAANELADLRLQVRNLERLLGRRTLELSLLRERLGKAEEDEILQ